MYILLIIVHVIVCLVLILVVLLQAGRGGGMSDMMGGGQPQSLFGTQTNQFMTRATEVCAILFVVTSLSLGIISTQRGKSLMERNRLSGAVNTALPGLPEGSGVAAFDSNGKPIDASSVPAMPATTPAPAAEPAAAPAAPATSANASAPAPVPAEQAKS